MKALKVDRRDRRRGEGHSSHEISWGALELDDTHDIWHDDEGLFKPTCMVATIGSHRRVPLPVHIMGHEGERSTSATKSVAELATLVRDVRATG